MITYLFPVTCVKNFSAGVLLKKVFLENLQNSQQNTCGEVSFLIKLQVEATDSDLSRVFS